MVPRWNYFHPNKLSHGWKWTGADEGITLKIIAGENHHSCSENEHMVTSGRICTPLQKLPLSKMCKVGRAMETKVPSWYSCLKYWGSSAGLDQQVDSAFNFLSFLPEIFVLSTFMIFDNGQRTVGFLIRGRHVCTGKRYEGTMPREQYFQPWDNFSFTSEVCLLVRCQRETSFAVDQWCSEVHTKLFLHSGNNNSA